MGEERKKEFESTALPHMDAIYNAALRMSIDSIEAEDLLQDTYLRAYRFFDKFKQGTNLKAWLFEILKNVFINKYRDLLKTPALCSIENAEAEGELADERTPEEEIPGGLFTDPVAAAIQTLTAEQRQAIFLADLEGFSYKEISEIIDCPIGTVMSRLHRGRKILRESLGAYAQSYGYIGQDEDFEGSEEDDE